MQERHPIRTVSFKTLGCKLNQSETDAIAQKFREKHFHIVPFDDPADLTVINTCTVTNDADRGSRHAIRHAIRTSPKGRIAVTGCYAQVKPEEIKAIEGVDLILGSDEKYKIFTYLDCLENGKLEQPLVYVNDQGEFDSVSEDGFVSAASRTRAILKIQEGCDYYCSYCIIPFSRGKARSRPFADTLAEAKKLVDKGYREITLTGINIGTYASQDGQSCRLADLLDALQQIPGLDRIRVSSIEPNTITDDLLRLIGASSVICPHMHIPLQSGHDDILTAMNRKYRIKDYAELMTRFGKYLPQAALGTDVIAGFPGESEEHFSRTLDFIMSQPFSYLHVFRYSPRDGTTATKLAHRIEAQVAKQRSQILHQTAKMLKLSYYRQFLGKVLPVLFDHIRDGVCGGYTNNYIQVEVISDNDLRNEIRLVLLKDCDEHGFMTGEIVVSRET